MHHLLPLQGKNHFIATMGNQFKKRLLNSKIKL